MQQSIQIGGGGSDTWMHISQLMTRAQIKAVDTPRCNRPTPAKQQQQQSDHAMVASSKSQAQSSLGVSGEDQVRFLQAAFKKVDAQVFAMSCSAFCMLSTGYVHSFCGSRMQHCTCNFRWNLAGWYKAVVLWNFVLSSAIGIQWLVIQLGLKGLLPGEEVVTRLSFISISWRLIPYWLNNWEQQWGAECSSLVFELPHFAVKLLVIPPYVQILCSRMKVLAMPSVIAALPPGRNQRPEAVLEECVPGVLCGCWERQPLQKHIWHRVRANKRIIGFTCLLCLLAGFNALVIPCT